MRGANPFTHQCRLHGEKNGSTPSRVYTTQPCTFCLAAKNLLKKRGLEWTEHLVFGGTPEWDAMLARTGGKSVPQIVIDNEVIGGFPQLQAYDKEGKLSELAEA